MERVETRRYNHIPHTQPSSSARHVMKQRLGIDLDFYPFVKQRLALQLQKLGLMEQMMGEQREHYREFVKGSECL